ncbi:hypothetical protein [Sporosarcina sp. A2]|uniref:hypothetical protein n=1 Tax=Sporosarcina sp. A2 TaxID=3393449 RepID=UPI003D7BA2C6
MNLREKLNNKVLEYILNKLAALGLLVFTMCVCTIFGTGFDLYDFTESLSNIMFWSLICGYALMTSVLIDLVSYKWREFTFKTSILLHCIAGYIVFIPFMGINFYSLIAGSVGALCAFIYAFSYYFLVRKKRLAWIFLLVIPLLLCIRIIDFTAKEGWTEEKTKSSFLAEFERFNGKNEIPISLKKGDRVTTYISFNEKNGGGYGYHFLDNNGELVAMKQLEEAYGDYDTSAIQFKAKKTGIYRLVLTGDNLKGEMDVKWEID